MTVTSTPPTSATQMATWTSEDNYGDDRFSATVVRQSSEPRDEAGRQGWSYILQHWATEGVGFHYTFARRSELLWTHDTDPLDVLATLASFMGAWSEAHRYGTPQSENRDLFPVICEPWLVAVEEFELWGYEHENPEDPDAEAIAQEWTQEQRQGNLYGRNVL